MKVLMATDGSADATQALTTATRLLHREGLEVCLICVAPEFLPGETNLLRDRYHRRMRQEKDRILEEARRRLTGSAMSITTHTEFGSAAEVITRLSANHDLTVIGAKGHDAPAHAGLGPAASRVAESCASPLWIGRSMKSPESARVLMAIDGSDNSNYAIDKAVELLDLDDAEITLLHVIETPWLNMGLEKEWLEEIDDEHARIDDGVLVNRTLQSQSRRLLLAAADRLRASHPGIVMTTEEGMAANEILSTAERGDFDLIVIGATGLTDLKQALLGSVSTRVAWDAPCSVLLARR